METRVEFRRNKRSLEQNSKMWSMLSEVAEQATHCGRKYTTEQWKTLFMHACGQEVQFIPALDGSTFVPWGSRSSELTKTQMGELIEFIYSWGTQNGVTFREPESAAA